MTEVYRNLESISDFNEFSKPEHYTALPSSWSVIVAHVPAAADLKGQHADINSIGAACIAAVKNALNKEEFPFVFAGDGATIVLPEVHRVSAVDALMALSRMVEKNYAFSLMVGSMHIHELEQSGVTVEVARYEIHSGMCIALFRGGGITMANRKIKDGQTPTEVETDASQKTQVDLNGMACRWNKIPSQNGHVMTILVNDNPQVPGEVYEYVTSQIDSILRRGGSASANPVNIESTTHKPLIQLIREERRFHASAFSFAFTGRLVSILITTMVAKFGLLRRFLGFKHYKNAMKTHADYRKFDDMLRMVIDCTQDQANAIEFMLQDMHQHGQKLFYGVFYSTHSLMACLFDDMADGSHIHFIDCDNGGYAMAAKALKEQIQRGVCDCFALHDPLMKTFLTDDEEASIVLGSEEISTIEVGLGGLSFDDNMDQECSLTSQTRVPDHLSKEEGNDDTSMSRAESGQPILVPQTSLAGGSNNHHGPGSPRFDTGNNYYDTTDALTSLEEGQQRPQQELEQRQNKNAINDYAKTKSKHEKSKKKKSKKKKKAKKAIKEGTDGSTIDLEDLEHSIEVLVGSQHTVVVEVAMTQ